MLARIAIISKEVLPSNKNLIDLLTSSWRPTYHLDTMLAGIHEAVMDTADNPQLFERFKDYIEEEEGKMAKKLHSIMYFIDATNTLNLVTGSGRLEKVGRAPLKSISLNNSRASICCLSSTCCYAVHGMWYGKHDMLHWIVGRSRTLSTL